MPTTPQRQRNLRSKDVSAQRMHVCAHIYSSIHSSVHPSIYLLSILRTEGPTRQIYSCYSDSRARLLRKKAIFFFQKSLFFKGKSHFRLINFDDYAFAKTCPCEMLQSEEVTLPTRTVEHPHWNFVSRFWTEVGHSELGESYDRTTLHPALVTMGMCYIQPLPLPSAPLSQVNKQEKNKGSVHRNFLEFLW